MGSVRDRAVGRLCTGRAVARGGEVGHGGRTCNPPRSFDDVGWVCGWASGWPGRRRRLRRPRRTESVATARRRMRRRRVCDETRLPRSPPRHPSLQLGSAIAGVPRPQGRPTQRSLCEHFRVLGRALAAAAIAKCDATVTAPAWRRPHTASAEAALCQAAPPPPHRLGARRHRPRCWVLLARPRSRFGPATLSPPAADAAAAPDAPLAARQRSHRRCSRRPPARPRTHGADIDASGSDANPLQGATP